MPDLPHTRQSLLIRLRDRSDDAWAEFLEIYEKAIIDYVRRKGLQEADALDVTQEVLAALESKLPTWDADPTKGRFRGWLFRVAHNITVDKIVERTRHPSTGGTLVANDLANIAEDGLEESAEFRKDYQHQLFHWAANRVRPRVSETSWKAFWLTAVEGRNTTEVAQELGLSRGNVYSAKLRVTNRIQKLVDRFDFEAQELPQ
ncbi:MAG: sigma-70 family RNA polymerase sigma factor [Planctomycetota bacterium]